MQEITGFTGVTLDTDQTITGGKTFTKTILGQADVVAYATNDYIGSLPIASTDALGCIKIGNNLSVREDGTLDANAGGGITEVDWSIIQNKPTFATVATSGSYNDLLNKPSLFSGIYNDLTNKPTIPTSTSQLTNNSGYITGISLSMWNSAATSYGNKTIGNSGNGNFVDIVEDMRVTRNCAFNNIPTVDGTQVSLNGHTHNYLPLVGGTLTGDLFINSSDYSYLRVSRRSNTNYYCSFAATNTTDTCCAIQGTHKIIMMARNDHSNKVTFDGGNMYADGDVVAYSTASAPSAFKY